MNANSFTWPVKAGIRDSFAIRCISKDTGIPRITALGAWIAMLDVLYESHGRIEIEKQGDVLRDELDLDCDDFQAFLRALAAQDFIDKDALERGAIISHGVLEQLAYRESKEAAGKRSGEARRKKAKANA